MVQRVIFLALDEIFSFAKRVGKEMENAKESRSDARVLCTSHVVARQVGTDRFVDRSLLF